MTNNDIQFDEILDYRSVKGLTSRHRDNNHTIKIYSVGQHITYLLKHHRHSYVPEQGERRRRSTDVSPPVSCGRKCKRGKVRWEERRREEGEESFKMSGSWSSSRGQDTPQAFMHTACTALQCTHACGGAQVGAEEYKSE